MSQSALAAAGIDRAGAGLIDMQYVGYGIKLSRRIQSSIWMIFLVSKGFFGLGTTKKFIKPAMDSVLVSAFGLMAG